MPLKGILWRKLTGIDKENRLIFEKIMLDYIEKYVSGKKLGDLGHILSLYVDEDFRRLFQKHSLNRARDHFQELLQEAESSNKSGLSSSDLDVIADTIKLCEDVLDFLDDLEKLYKIFEKKGVETDYLDILALFAGVIEDKKDLEYEKILAPAYKRISNRLGRNVTTENAVKEFMKILSIWHMDESNSEIIFRILDKFNLSYSEDKIRDLIETTKEELDLEKFEENLGYSKKLEIGDYFKLDGHEFEEYLKNLFKLLGYSVVRTPLVGDQGADLIVSKNGEKTVVQAKKYSGKVSNGAIQEIVAAKNHYKADKSIVITNSSFTKSAIELALTNNVELWDGAKLKGIVKSLKIDDENELHTSTSMTLKNDKKVNKIKIKCPFCEGDFEYVFDTKKDTFDIKCPNCGSDLQGVVTNRNRYWTCEYCFEKFDSKEEARKHEKICRKKFKGKKDTKIIHKK